MARLKSTRVTLHSVRRVQQNCHNDFTWPGRASSTVGVSAKICLQRCRAWLPSGAHRQHMYLRVTYAWREDKPWRSLGVRHRVLKTWLPREGHSMFKPGNRRSGAQTTTLGCKCLDIFTRGRSVSTATSPCAQALCPERSAAGRTQRSPSSFTRPSSILRVTSSTACVIHAASALATAAAAAVGHPSATDGDGAPLDCARLSCSFACWLLLGLAECEREAPRSMSRTESCVGSL